MNVSVAELKADLSAILKRAAEGEEIVVTKHGRPYVEVRAKKPLTSEEIIARRKAFIGSMKEGYWMADDFDAPMDDFGDAPLIPDER